ncbi:MAG: 3'(2'),5'-bisphosphate nucleotidase CysQ [Sedimentisphaerales bacterium]|nr:3'(2'),5'-bisphosphate nucleotidase CysQ [Sedimentisphaerales bacterium]
MDRLEKDLTRIQQALAEAAKSVSAFTPGRIATEKKAGGDPVTAADLAVDKVLKEMLLAPGEGWLSEETVDNSDRLDRQRVWIVDPIDGTREFVEGVPEWCISVGLIVNGRPVAGGILNPPAGQLFLGTVEAGVTLNGTPAQVTEKTTLAGARVLASRSEIRKGLWKPLESAPFEIVPCGSIAYKLAQVAAGLADATISLAPKNEWDVAAGAALVAAGGGRTEIKNDPLRPFNQRNTLMDGFTACGQTLWNMLNQLL